MNADQQKQFEEWWASQEHFASKYRAAERAYAAAKSSDAATIRELRELREALKVARDCWEPQFDVMSPEQERLAIEFCMEIAGPKGKPGCPPDPVRLLEMAYALYKAERDHMLEAITKERKHELDI